METDPTAGVHRTARRVPICRYCRETLEPNDEATGHCGAPVCLVRARNEAERRPYRANWNEAIDDQEAVLLRHGAEIAAAARQTGVDPNDLPVGVVPMQRRPLRPLPQDRIDALKLHVRDIIAASFERPPDEDLRRRREVGEAPEGLATQSACILCQGHCCILGAGRQAFLTVETIDAVRLRHPDLEAEEIFETYIARLPGEAYEDSCLYHGAQGCTNDRTWRSGTCNTFSCNGKRQVMAQVTSRSDEAVLWIASEVTGDRSGAVVHHAEGGLRVAEKDRAGAASAASAAAARLPRRIVEQDRPAGDVCEICGNPIPSARAGGVRICGAAICASIKAARP